MTMTKADIAHFCILALFLLLFFTLPAYGGPVSWVSFQVDKEERDALLCRPEGTGPFPTVVFNHGSIVDGNGVAGASGRGYKLEVICQTLAEDGFLTFAPIREKVPRGKGYQSYNERYKEVVSRAVDYVKTVPGIDPSRIALMGFSMGGLISLEVAIQRKDLKALLLLAPAMGRGVLAEVVEGVSSVTAPALVLVAADDSPPILKGVGMLEQALKTHGKEGRVVRYKRGGGHELFYNVDYWWDDVKEFLREKLRATPGR